MKAYKKKILYIIFTVIILLNIPFGSFCQTIKDTTNLPSIQFIPRDFHDVKLGNYGLGANKCTPHYPYYSDYLYNEIKINVPEKIIFRKPISKVVPVIPVCGTHVITLRRGEKYIHLSAKILYIKKINDETWCSGQIITEDEGSVIYSLDYEAEERERQDRIRKAQKYSDDELNEGQAAGSVINVNLMDFVDISLTTGIYEIYLTYKGLESNHARVEIIFEGDEKVQDTRLINKAEIPDEIEAIEEEELPEI